MGYRLWYDEGIKGGDEWWRIIVQHINLSCFMLLFMSPEADKSTYVEDEFRKAQSHEITIFPVYLQSVPNMVLPVERLHHVELWNANFFEKLCRGLTEKTKHDTAPQPSPETDFVWKTDDDSATLIGYKGKEKDVVIPTMYQGKQVSSILGSGSQLPYTGFGENQYIETVYIPEGVVFLDGGVFRACHNLRSITIPKSVKIIGGGLFMNCKSLNNVILPEGIKTIGEVTFFGCESLTDLTIPASVTTIWDDAFYDDYFLPNPYLTSPYLTFHCPRDSYAEHYARTHSFKVQYTDQEAPL